ncbi:GIY-YIG nuclease family protein [Erythrobacter sp. SCSIO 43205]|uniref:GIY-YIG nuclease family protein n=1 Tax=Erythrobacter sp. SCSIO 43205 TaxID=2779361 RepID=UPI001CA96657|nr:GIY-YIG nuclease family protein [Erythrobacter sp. SCSIO 43205]UAB77445.1 GIY-YIG nuclease family protein [Erythrobacter sp. SCSIO 43205]
MERPAWVYIVASQRNGTIYIGHSTDLAQRIHQHREGQVPGFTRKYECKQLVWFERFSNVIEAREFEQRMKKWNRAWKLKRIEERNPQWLDLYEGLASHA